MPTQEELQARSLYEQGMSTREIGEILHRGKRQVGDMIRGAGGTLRPKGGTTKPVIPLEDQEVRRLYESGTPLDTIARQVCRSKTTVAKMVQRAGGTIGPGGRAKARTKRELSTAEKEEAVALYDQGASFDKIGNMLGTSTTVAIRAVVETKPLRRCRYCECLIPATSRVCMYCALEKGVKER